MACSFLYPEIVTAKWTIDRYRQAINAGIFEDRQIELLK